MNVLAYEIDGNCYLNMTNRCSNACTFCVRNGKETYEGYPLWLREGEPTAEQVLNALGDPTRYREVVFCGFGEPTYRMDILPQIARRIKELGGKTRLNTNGHGNLICGRRIAPELVDVDLINVSLNEVCGTDYDTLCRPIFEGAHDALRAFAKDCLAEGIAVVYSVVDILGEEKLQKARQIADTDGVALRVRPYIEP